MRHRSAGTRRLREGALPAGAALLIAGLVVGVGAAWANQDDTYAMDFGQQQVRTTSPAQPIVVENATFEPPLRLYSIRTTGDFTETNNCPAAVPPGQRCEIRVMFAPNSTGSRTGRLWIDENRAASPVTVALTGVGVTSAPAPQPQPSPVPPPPSPPPANPSSPPASASPPPPPPPVSGHQPPSPPSQPPAPPPVPNEPSQASPPPPGQGSSPHGRTGGPAQLPAAPTGSGSQGGTTRAAAAPGAGSPPASASWEPAGPAPTAGPHAPDPAASLTPGVDASGGAAMPAHRTAAARVGGGARGLAVLAVSALAGLCGAGGIVIRLRRRR